jgi:hypothetical protein
MQDFADSGRAYSDFTAAQVWDLQCSINEELRKHGLETYNEQVEVTYEMARLLHLILDLARRSAYPLPSPEMLLEYMTTQAPRFQALLERHPDGGRDSAKEQERMDRWRAIWKRKAAEWKDARPQEPSEPKP